MNSFLTGQKGQQFYGVPKGHYSTQEQSVVDFVVRTERSLANWTTPKTAFPGAFTPLVDNTSYLDSYPMLLNHPRKLSSTSVTSSANSTTSRESFGSGMRMSSWGSKTSFDSMESINAQAQQRWPSYQRPAPIKALRKSRPGEMFATLPGEVLELILDELKKLHLGKGSESCATCWMRDLGSISLTSRKWHKFARTSLYEDIQIVGPDSTAMKKRYKGCPSPRLALLRRTLRSSQQIAVIVHLLKVPPVPEGTPVDKYHDLVASVVMACPNLERLLGLHPRYNHSFDRLFHALSTRVRLKQMEWIVEAVPPSTPPSGRPSSKHANKAAAMAAAPAPRLTPGDLSAAQSTAFLDHHFNWTHLTTLSIHSLPGGTITPDSLIPTVVSYLPSLQHLFLSRLPFTAFKDNGMLSLPRLKTLSLSHLSGITSNGLSAFATRSESQALQKLVLRHINLDEMPALARVLSNLTQLESFALVQSFPPMMPEDNAIWLMPYLASASLQKIHWDITSHPHCANAADSLLAKSIAANGFPSLRSLRAPNDPEGIFQALCRPRERCDTPLDRFRGSMMHGRSLSGSGKSLSMPSSPTRMPIKKTPTSPMLASHGGEGTLRNATDLQQARLAAQARLEAARRFPRYFAKVVDENGMLVDKFGLAGFIGAPESRIQYDLLPDPGVTDEGGGLVDVDDVLGDCGESALGSEACNGRWNLPSGPVDKKDRDKWWHTERGRWTDVHL